MNGNRSCGCKGIRICKICENYKDNKKSFNKAENVFTYCCHCCQAWNSWETGHPSHTGGGIDFPGIVTITDFISESEERSLCEHMDGTCWINSQSGRRKQDFGPKVNFKKKKLKTGKFTGLPHYSKLLVERMRSHSALQDFIAVELCNLEYTPERGSAIDPHFDDFWLWGDRLVTLNLLSLTYLTMSRDENPDVQVVIPMPARCLLVVSGDARYKWKHAIHQQDVTSRRLAMTFRELTPEFLPGGQNEDLGGELISISQSFQGEEVNRAAHTDQMHQN